MKPARAYLAVGLVCTGVLIIPVGLSFATSKLTPKEKEEVRKCVTAHEACDKECREKHANERLSYTYCREQCRKTEVECISKAVSRTRPGDAGSGLLDPPPVAPPKPTPLKAKPQSVGDVSAAQPAIKTSPTPTPAKLDNAGLSVPIKKRVSPTPTPSPSAKQ